jgi:uncharacterized membrane protein YheB (UPF0754 family)
MFLLIDFTSWQTYAIPLISAFIGWITNYIAIKMLFYPRDPKKILFMTFHGIFPKNKSRIAENLGQVVQRDLINFSDIKERFKDPDALNNFKEEIALRIDDAIRGRLSKNPVLNSIVPEQFIQSIHKTLTNEIEAKLPEVIESSISKIEQKVDIYTLVRNKVNNFSDQKLEEMLLNITSKEFKFIELIGGVLGFFIGIIQVIISGIGN